MVLCVSRVGWRLVALRVWCAVVCCTVVWCGCLWCAAVWCGVLWCAVGCGVEWGVALCGVVAYRSWLSVANNHSNSLRRYLAGGFSRRSSRDALEKYWLAFLFHSVCSLSTATASRLSRASAMPVRRYFCTWRPQPPPDPADPT